MNLCVRMVLCGMICAFLMGGCPGSKEVDPAGHPTQTKILFRSYREGKSQLYLMDLDGSNLTRLTSETNGAFRGIVTPDGREVVFISEVWSPQCDLVRANIDGTARTVLVAGTVTTSQPQLTADGSRVVFVMSEDNQRYIASIKLDGTGLVNLSKNPPGTDVGGPIMRPGTSRVGFVSNASGNHEIYEVDAAGGDPVNLTQNAAYDYSPIYSPDGSKILFSTNRDGQDELYIMNADGSDPIRLTNSPNIGFGVAFSPDGSKVLYLMPVPSDHPSGFDPVATDVSTLHVVNVDGTGERELAIANSLGFVRPWSPDGRKIVFGAREDTTLDIFVINADGTGLTKLTNSPGDDVSPMWSPDGQEIFFESSPTGFLQISSMRSDGTDQRNLSNSSGFDFFERFVEIQ